MIWVIEPGAHKLRPLPVPADLTQAKKISVEWEREGTIDRSRAGNVYFPVSLSEEWFVYFVSEGAGLLSDDFWLRLTVEEGKGGAELEL